MMMRRLAEMEPGGDAAAAAAAPASRASVVLRVTGRSCMNAEMGYISLVSAAAVMVVEITQERWDARCPLPLAVVVPTNPPPTSVSQEWCHPSSGDGEYRYSGPK